MGVSLTDESCKLFERFALRSPARLRVGCLPLKVTQLRFGSGIRRQVSGNRTSRSSGGPASDFRKRPD